MNTNMERFQEKLDALENGERIEDCLEGLDPSEAELLQLAALLRTFNPPARKEEAVMAQLASLAKMAEDLQAVTANPTHKPRIISSLGSHLQPGKDLGMKRNHQHSTRWMFALAASAFALVAIVAFVGLATLGLWWAGVARAQSATLADVSGEVMVAPDGSNDAWQPVSNGNRIRPGQQLHVGADSAASLVFYEGSRVILGAGSQITLNQLSGNWFKSLKVELVQEAGTTRHSVVPFRGSRSTYQVITPSSTANVHGTSFSVAVDEGGYARFAVDTGEVLVQRDTNEVTLTAGQAAVAQTDALTLDAAYQFTLIGSLTGMGEDGWSVNEVTFMVTPDTRITGEPQIGLQVFVEGRILGGEHVADRILVLTDGQSESSFTGILESKDGEIWRVGGVDVRVTSDTQLVGDLQVGKPVKVIFIVSKGGEWVALEIIALEEPAVKPTPTPTDTESITPTPTDTESITPTPTNTKPITPTFTAAPTSLPIDLPNCYRITFLGVVDHGDGSSTWRYAVEELACAQDLSNWVLELPGCAQIINASPSPWEAVHPDPNLGLNGIKWGVGAGFESGEFSVTLSGALTTGITRAGAKGPDEAIGSIPGPACDLGTATATPAASTTLTVTIPTTATTTPPASIGPIVISDNDQNLTINCNGAAVTVNGNSNTITLLGSCSSLTVRGNNNHITLESSTIVTDTGNGNVITMPSAPPASPQTTPTALPPAASPPTQPPPVSAGPIVITDNDQVLTINCNGAAVTVNGNSNTLTLLGTCSSLTVRGNNNVITLQSPTVVTNTGNGNIIK